MNKNIINIISVLAIVAFVLGILEIINTKYIIVASIFLAFIAASLKFKNSKVNKKNYYKNKNIYKYYALAVGFIVIYALIIEILSGADSIIFSKYKKLIYIGLIISIILLLGLKAEDIPRNPILGLRLPWLYKSDQTWKSAHKFLSKSSLPFASIFAITAIILPYRYMGILIAVTIILWVGLSSLIPYIKSNDRI